MVEKLTVMAVAMARKQKKRQLSKLKKRYTCFLSTHFKFVMSNHVH
jgi:hypothetical protein